MRDRHCLQCGVFIKSGKGWKQQSTRRGGGLVHDSCLDNYIKHKKIASQIKKNIRQRHYRRMNKHKIKKWNSDFYRKHNTKIRTRNYIYYHTNADRLREYQRNLTKKRYHNETDDEFLVKIWPRWKTNNGWII